MSELRFVGFCACMIYVLSAWLILNKMDILEYQVYTKNKEINKLRSELSNLNEKLYFYGDCDKKCHTDLRVCKIQIETCYEISKDKIMYEEFFEDCNTDLVACQNGSFITD